MQGLFDLHGFDHLLVPAHPAPPGVLDCITYCILALQVSFGSVGMFVCTTILLRSVVCMYIRTIVYSYYYARMYIGTIVYSYYYVSVSITPFPLANGLTQQPCSVVQPPQSTCLSHCVMVNVERKGKTKGACGA